VLVQNLCRLSDQFTLFGIWSDIPAPELKGMGGSIHAVPAIEAGGIEKPLGSDLFSMIPFPLR